MNFNVVTEFENKIAEFFGAPYAIAVDACTHGVELSLRYTNADNISVPKNTYLSIRRHYENSFFDCALFYIWGISPDY